VLAEHPAVREAVTVLRENAPGEKQLVAYVVPTTLGSMLEPLILRQYLQPLVPDYMVPAAFVLLDNLPLTPNGKVNRHALPEPDQTHRARATSFVPARTPLEELLTEIWQDLLKVEHIGVHDNFFALGGHSLSVTQVISRLRKILELDLPVRTIFEHPTVAQLAKEIDTQLATSFPDWPRDESPTSFCPPRT
jgi:acyl carrier protein